MTPNQSAEMLGVVIRSFSLTMQKTILIGLAGLAGTLLRYWLSGYVARQYWGNISVGNNRS